MKTKSVLLVLVLMIATSAGIQSQNMVPVTIRVVFPFDVSDVECHEWWWGQGIQTMTQTGSREYAIEYQRTSGLEQVLMFNISYKLPEYNSMELWLLGITGGVPEGDPTGIIYGKLYVNNILLNNSFVARNINSGWTNFFLSVNADNTITPIYDNDNQPVLIDDRIPAEVAWRKRYSRQYPSDDFNRINGWMQVITDNNILDSSKVEVDYLRLYGRTGNTLTLLKDDEFNSFDTLLHGGMYLRYPFFPPGFDEHDPMPATATDGILTFYPSDNRTKVWHWWNSEQTYLPNIYAYDSYRFECKIRITGHAIAQGGIDFINHTSKSYSAVHYELGVSDWYFENNGEWQIVVFDSDPNALQANQLIQNKTISDGEGQCFDATHTITVKDFYVMNGGTATLIAGENILIQPVTEIESGAHLNAYITQEHSYCLQPESLLESLNHVASTKFIFPSKNAGSLLSLFPNPTSGKFTLELIQSEEGSIILVSIYSIMGEMLLQAELPSQNKYEFDISNHPKGIYIIQVIVDDGPSVVKLIKQ